MSSKTVLSSGKSKYIVSNVVFWRWLKFKYVRINTQFLNKFHFLGPPYKLWCNHTICQYKATKNRQDYVYILIRNKYQDILWSEKMCSTSWIIWYLFKKISLPEHLFTDFGERNGNINQLPLAYARPEIDLQPWYVPWPGIKLANFWNNAPTNWASWPGIIWYSCFTKKIGDTHKCTHRIISTASQEVTWGLGTEHWRGSYIPLFSNIWILNIY